jgi:Flp pilus assembly protein TadG
VTLLVRSGDEDGSLAMPLLVLVWVSFVLTVALVDVGAYLLAASRAQGAADAAALAAVAADLAAPAPAEVVARSVAGRNGARVEACDCRAGVERVAVTVSVPVGGLFIARHVGAERVTASAEALLVEAEGRPDEAGDQPW